MPILSAQAASSSSISVQQNVNLNVASLLSLAGDWQFYWQQTLSPKDFVNPSEQTDLSLPISATIKVPSSWKGQSLDQQTNKGNPLPRDGYATYRLQQEIPPQWVKKDLSLSVRYVSSAYRIWIDGHEFAGLGKVGTTANEETPESRAMHYDFRPQSSQIEIVMQVSNFSYSEPGITQPVVLGPASLVEDFQMRNYVIRDLVFIGVFFALAIFHLILYFLRKNEQSLLWLSLIGWTAGFRTFLINEHFVHPMFPAFTWEWVLRSEFVMDVGLFLCIVMYTKVMYSNEMKSWYMRVFYVYVALFACFILFVPTIQFTSNFLAQYILVTFFLILLIHITAVAVIRKREGAWFNVITLGLTVIGVLNDIVYYAGLVETVPIFAITICLYLMAQASIVARRYAFTMRQSQELSHHLATINADLEQQVKQRTQERINFLTNIAHDIGAPLLSVQSALMLLRDGSFSPDKQAQLLDMMVAKSDYARQMVQDLFDLLKLESGEVELHLEKIAIGQFISDVAEKFQTETVATGKQITLYVHPLEAALNVEPYASIDVHRMKRVMQNLLDNAVKFSRGLCDRIELKSVVSASQWHVEIIDFGSGIAEEMIPFVFKRFYAQKHTVPGFNESGSGIGLSIVKEIIEHHQGEVGVRSKVGKGSAFFFTIPLVVDND